MVTTESTWNLEIHNSLTYLCLEKENNKTE